MYTREQMVALALKYKGASKGSARHKDLVNTFNKVKPNGEVANYKCAWCAITVTALAIKAGFTTKNFPMSYNCGTMITKAKALGVWKESDSYKPQIGDVIIYAWGDNGKGDCKTGASHTGIIVSVSGNNFNVLEGNKGTSSACGIRKMTVNGRYIRGFIIPKYNGKATPYDYHLAVDGDWGYKTTITSQHILNVAEDGDFGAKSIKALQKLVGAKVDGEWGTNTTKAMQKFLKVKIDGKKNKTTIKAWQTYCNKVIDGNKTTTKETPSQGEVTTELPSLRVKKTAEQVAQDACKWAKVIASDNTYHYGEYGKKAEKEKHPKFYAITHRCGCHFCNTNHSKKVVPANKIGLKGENWEYTYVCNTFTTAAYAHGGQDKKTYTKCHKGSCYGLADSTGKKNVAMDKSGDWKNLGKIACDKMKPGDILLSPTHAQMYYGKSSTKKAKIVEATSYTGKYGSKASNNSIRIIDKNPSYTTVYRYIGSVNRDIALEIGEYSDRVKLWQKFIGITADGFFGDKTKDATAKWQKSHGLEPDGIVGAKTLAKAKAVKK